MTSSLVINLVTDLKKDIASAKSFAGVQANKHFDMMEALNRATRNLDKLLIALTKCEECGHTQTVISGIERAGEDWG